MTAERFIFDPSLFSEGPLPDQGGECVVCGGEIEVEAANNLYCLACLKAG